MSKVEVEVPEEVLISLKETPVTLSRLLPILAAVKLFELGKLSLLTSSSVSWDVTSPVPAVFGTVSGFSF